MIRCPACKGGNPSNAEHCQHCGVKFIRKPRPVEVEVEEEDEAQEQAVQVKRRPSQPEEAEDVELVRPKAKRRRVILEDEDEDSGGAIIPYRNPLALIGYYAAFLGVIIGIGAMAAGVYLCWYGANPRQDINMAKTVIYIGVAVGVIVDLAAFVMGIFGFFYARSHRKAKGGGHALSSVVMGALFLIGQLICLVLVLQYFFPKL